MIINEVVTFCSVETVN